tara:strand:+ start:9616 stop:10878 length:1263 start_codon:yes stop_codon:yes gene_type:complete
MKKIIDSIKIDKIFLNERRNCLFGHDIDKKYFIKIQFKRALNKRNDLKEEYKIIKFLNDSQCQTAPVVYEYGNIDREFILERMVDKSISVENSTYNYIIQDYLKTSSNYSIGDVIFTMIEQKNLGVYQGDVKPDNIKYCEEKDICYFVDYDQAVKLTDGIKQLSTYDFLRFCSKYDKEKYGIGDWERHFKNMNFPIGNQVLTGTRLNLSNVKLFKNQNTTNTDSGFYHAIDTREVFLDAHRNMKARSKIMDKIYFKEQEIVLDVGCNTGILSEYLYDRGCNVDGFDIDDRIITACKILSNITAKKNNYFVQNLDKIEKLKKYDTILLFSVFHHTLNYKQNGIKIANSCNRIIIETRPIERGSQPDKDGQWKIVSGWKFNSVNDLVKFLEQIFKGFKLKKNHGQCDKNRYILEFIKESKTK